MNLKQNLQQHDLCFDDIFFERIDKYKQILKLWGATHNLTSCLDDKFIENNIIDSLYILKFLAPFESFADIGTGAGYPGLILSIAKQNTKCYLIESNNKKSAFLSFVVESLKLKNTKVISKKVELCKDIKPQLIVSRAVSNTQKLLSLSKNIADENSSYLLYKGSSYEDELKEIKKKTEVIDGLDNRRYIILT